MGLSTSEREDLLMGLKEIDPYLKDVIAFYDGRYIKADESFIVGTIWNIKCRLNDCLVKLPPDENGREI